MKMCKKNLQFWSEKKMCFYVFFCVVVVVKRCWRFSNPSHGTSDDENFDFWGDFSCVGGQIFLLLVVVFKRVFFSCKFWFGSGEVWARDALPLITTCNQIVSKFLNYGSSLLRLNGFFVGGDDDSCGERGREWKLVGCTRPRASSSYLALSSYNERRLCQI